MDSTLESKMNGLALEEFGKNMRKHFLFADGYRNLNHGSFGAVPRAVLDTQRELQAALEARPDVFFRTEAAARLYATRQQLAALLRAPPANVVMVPNATTGVNTVLRNAAATFAPGDVILHFGTAYGACEKTIISLAETTPVAALCVPLAYPVADAEVLERFEAAVEGEHRAGRRVRFALFDTISSQPGVRMPFERLTELCRKHGVLSLIDAAHGVGHLPLDLTALDPDFFVSNLHKWLYTPRPCAVLYVAQRHQPLIRTTYPTSHGFAPLSAKAVFDPLAALDDDDEERAAQMTPFVKNFEFVGTTDTSPYLCVPAALRFRERVCGGEERIRAYCARLAQRGGDAAARILGTECMENAAGTIRAGNAMVQVGLPLDGVTDAIVQPWMHAVLMQEFNTLIPVFEHGGRWWARFSAQIYLDEDDFEWGAKVLLGLCERVRKGEHLAPKKAKNVSN